MSGDDTQRMTPTMLITAIINEWLRCFETSPTVEQIQKALDWAKELASSERDAATKDENEACAKVSEGFAIVDAEPHHKPIRIAAAIRSRVAQEVKA